MSLRFDWHRVKSDVNGNPRYVVHWLAFKHLCDDEDMTYDKAHRIAKKLGFSKYRGKDYGGGLVTQSYSLEHTEKHMIEHAELVKLQKKHVEQVQI